MSSRRSNELLDIISEGESDTVEFKRKFSSAEKIAREIIAFANSHGGQLMLGVDDDRTVCGVSSEKEEIGLVEIACSYYCDPPIAPRIEIAAIRGKDVIVVHVPESRSKPHWLRVGDNQPLSERQAFIRLQDKTVAASKEVIKVMRGTRPDAPPVKVSIGRLERALFDYLDVHSRITVAEFKKLVNISERRASSILVRLVRAGVLYIHTFEKEEFFTATGAQVNGI